MKEEERELRAQLNKKEKKILKRQKERERKAQKE